MLFLVAPFFQRTFIVAKTTIRKELKYMQNNIAWKANYTKIFQLIKNLYIDIVWIFF